MKKGTLKGFQTRNIGPGRLVELSGGCDHDCCVIDLVCPGFHSPLIGGFVKGGAADLLIEPYMLAQRIFVDTVAHVVINFRLQAELPRPVVLGLERK